MSVALFAATDAELARVDRTCWRQSARIKMKRINADHSRIDVDIRFQKISQRLRRNIAATRDCDVRVPGTELWLDADGERGFLHTFVDLKEMWVCLTDADPNDFRRALC